MSSHRLISRSLPIGLAAAALAASSASAGPPLQPIIPVAPHVISQQERQVIASRGQGAPDPVRGPVAHVSPQPKTVADDGFDWGSAGIGAGAAGGLTLLVFGSVGLAHRRRMGYAR